MADTVWGAARAMEVEGAPRHRGVVRATHWLTTVCLAALVLSGLEIVVSHPRFYWGETGNVQTTPLFRLPIPASRRTVPTGYGYVLPDQNGWSRYLHFQAAWAAVLTGLVYVGWGWASGHFGRNLMPERRQSWGREARRVVAGHLGRGAAREEDAWSYNVLQRLTYLGVIFVLFPGMIWTGLAMSPGFAAAAPWAVEALGGQQSARTLHFLGTLLLMGFVGVHLAMVAREGFGRRVGAMITGRTERGGK